MRLLSWTVPAVALALLYTQGALRRQKAMEGRQGEEEK